MAVTATRPQIYEFQNFLLYRLSSHGTPTFCVVTRVKKHPIKLFLGVWTLVKHNILFARVCLHGNILVKSRVICSAIARVCVTILPTKGIVFPIFLRVRRHK